LDEEYREPVASNVNRHLVKLFSLPFRRRNEKLIDNYKNILGIKK